MARRNRRLASIWSQAFSRNLKVLARDMSRGATQTGVRLAGQVAKAALKKARQERQQRQRATPAGRGDWIGGVAMGGAGLCRYRLYRPPAVSPGGVVAGPMPLLVMLHGCGQDAQSFALSTRMNRVAAREGFMVLYPEQDKLANGQGCWNWFDTRSGRAYAEAALLMKAIDQVARLYPVDPQRIAVAGLSAGASMAALLATRHPQRFKAVVMHSGVPPGMANSTASALGAMRGSRKAPVAAAIANADDGAATGRGPWPPLLVIHGAGDRVVAASNAQAAAQLWADTAGARPTAPRRVSRGLRHPMTVTDFKLGRRTVATWVQVERLGHAWSGGAASQPFGDERGADASRMVWAFVSKQFVAGKP